MSCTKCIWHIHIFIYIYIYMDIRGVRVFITTGRPVDQCSEAYSCIEVYVYVYVCAWEGKKKFSVGSDLFCVIHIIINGLKNDWRAHTNEYITRACTHVHTYTVHQYRHTRHFITSLACCCWWPPGIILDFTRVWLYFFFKLIYTCTIFYVNIRFKNISLV